MTSSAPKLRPVPEPNAGIVIEKDIPLAPHGNSASCQSRSSKYPFADMEIGDSFFVECRSGETQAKVSARVQSASLSWRKSAGVQRKFTVRRENNGIRIWRTA